MDPIQGDQGTLPRAIYWFRNRIAGDELVGEFVFFSLSTGAFQVSRLVVNLFSARWLGPETFGLWNASYLFLLYGPLIGLGVPSGMNREIPLLRGAGQDELADRVAVSSFWFVLLSGSLGALITTIALMSGLIASFDAGSIAAMGSLFLIWQLYQYFQMRLRSNIRFRLMTIQQLFFAGLLPLVVLPLTYSLRLTGFIVGQGFVAVLSIGLIMRMGAFHFEVRLDWSTLWDLIKIGFPIMAAGLLYSLLTSIDRWVILRFLGVEALGQYTLAILSVSILNLLPAVISQQLYPRMAFLYGSTGNVRSLIPMVLRQSVTGMFVTLPLIAITIFLMPLFVGSFLPEYTEGLQPARILLLGLAFIPLGGGVANFLNTIGKQVYYLAVQAGAVIINFGLNLYFMHLGLGINGVAMGAASSYLVYSLALIIVGTWVLKRDEAGITH